MSRATAVCRSVIASHSRQVVRASAAASRFPAVRESAGAVRTVVTFRRVRTPFVVSASWISTYGEDESGSNEVYVNNEEVERLRTSLARLENDVSKQNESVNQQKDSVKLVEEALRNIDNDGWFTPRRAPQLAYLRDRPPDERQTLLMDVLKLEKEDLRKQEERLDAAKEDLRKQEERLDAAMERLDAAKGDRRKEKLATSAAVQKEVFKFDQNCWLPQEVPLRELYEEEPRRFVASERWLRNVTASIEERLIERDSEGGASRVAGTGLVRCSRGGKTRSLFEIGKWFKENRPDVAVLFVTFNDESSVQKNEQSDPVAALCNRIAWRAHKGSNNKRLGFHSFRAKYRVDQDDVIAWLGSTRRLLLIDEINKLRGSRESFEFGDFLKENFLSVEGQYFVFTSHELTTSTMLLTEVIDQNSPSPRIVNVFELPTVPSLLEAQRALDWPNLLAHQAIYHGLVPALLVTTLVRDRSIPNLRSEVVEKWANKIKEKDQQRLFLSTLTSFFSGDKGDVPVDLLPLMDSTGSNAVRWIPLYLHTFLKEARRLKFGGVDPDVRRVFKLMDEKLNEFYSSKEGSGDRWEALFAVALAMRALLGESHKIASFSSSGRVSIDKPFRGVGADNIADPQVYLNNIPNRSKPGVSIYLPSSSTFRQYDVFLVVWDEEGIRSVINGYQLKEGREIVRTPPCPLVTTSFLVRGEAPEKPRNTDKKLNSQDFDPMRGEEKRWIDVSDEDISDFFGVSGAFWTPKKWKELKREENDGTL